ncbi:MAG TPA: 1-acyl-sn-glycerol-3-phosphate acyltransferase [Clostridiaceae bacterium]|nr:1-acyl-sn-glycerol-3-phosphate acyltransferase [Clostridiaceae bacterium]
MNDSNKGIPIFFAVDDGYIPFLAVTLQSLVDNSSSSNQYSIKILHTNVNEENKRKISKYQRENIDIEFVNLNCYVEKVKDKLFTRDYYTNTTYFRLFIPELYPQYEKALYLDSDTVVLADIAELYNTDIGENLVAAAQEGVIQNIKVYQDYVEKVVGVASYKRFFNAGVLLMNLNELRRFQFQDKILYLLSTVKYSVIQDEDYLNRMCKGRVKFVDSTWNKMPIDIDNVKIEDIKLIHFNYVYKPWHFDNVLYGEIFWEYAQKTEFINDIKFIKENYTEEKKNRDIESDKNLRLLAQKECDCVGDDRQYRPTFETTKSEIEKSKERLEILEKIKKLELEGKFDIDAENDPPTIVLTPENVDYLKKKTSSKIKNKVANKVGEKFLKDLLKNNKLIIKEVNGIENLQNLESGAVITCNHFNPFDSFSIERVFRLSGQAKTKKLYKVIREGNYTNFPGLYGFFFRNCDTLPLSSNKRTMIEFMKAVDIILQRGDFILIYPEQSLWWNYKKPKPLKNGAFKFATRNNVPVIPIFITMQDSNIIGEDGFFVQEYIINIEKPIYSNEKLSERENTTIMRDKNYEIWKNIYEDFYKVPLQYTTINEEK